MGKELTSSPILPISLRGLGTDCERSLSRHWLPYALAFWNPTQEQSVVKTDAPWMHGVTREDFLADLSSAPRRRTTGLSANQQTARDVAALFEKAATRHRHVRAISRPDRVGSDDLQMAEQIRVHPMSRRSLAFMRFAVQRVDADRPLTRIIHEASAASPYASVTGGLASRLRAFATNRHE